MGSPTNIQLSRLSGVHIGRQGPLCATVMCEDPDAHLPSEYDGFEAISLCAQQTSISDQLMPGSGGTEASHPRHTSNFHEFAELTRSNAKARSILHSPNDACTFQTCATAGMPQDSCRTQAASSHSRHNSQYSRRGGRWLGLALGYRQPWLITCGMRSPHAVSVHGTRIRESGEWQWTLIPLAEQRAFVTQPDEDSKAVRFRRHTICNECQDGTRFAQHASRQSSDCLPHEARERRRALEHTRMSLPVRGAYFPELSSITARGSET